MGDMADLMYDSVWEQHMEEQHAIADFLSLTDDELKEMCKYSRKPIILGIRKWDRSLSNKQRVLLAKHIVEMEDHE